MALAELERLSMLLSMVLELPPPPGSAVEKAVRAKRLEPASVVMRVVMRDDLGL